MPLAKKKIEEKLLDSVSRLSAKGAKELLDYAEFLKLREDEWFVDFVNRRTQEAVKEKRRGAKFLRIEDLQRHYGKG